MNILTPAATAAMQAAYDAAWSKPDMTQANAMRAAFDAAIAKLKEEGRANELMPLPKVAGFPGGMRRLVIQIGDV